MVRLTAGLHVLFLCQVRAVLYGIETGDANTNVRQYLRHLAGKPLLYEREKPKYLCTVYFPKTTII